MPLPHHDILLVERAVSEMKRGVPVTIEGESGAILALSVEYLDEASLALLQEFSSQQPSVIITANRAHHLNPHISFDSAVKVPFKDIETTQLLSGISEGKTESLGDITSVSQLEYAAVKLAKIAELMPAVIICPVEAPLPDILITLTPEHLDHYKESVATSLEEISRANLPLHRAENSSIVAFRSPYGGKEHYAILVGENVEKQKDPLVRVHSSCYTGDLIASLACDCRDQLHTSIRLMGEGNGGIVLYLQQEGRGIGLTNKIRAYAQKDNGLDTVDANEALGFDDDERLFRPAAEMLKSLGIKGVKLLSNNPRKAEGLEEFGIKVTATVPHIMPMHKHNADYLNTKAERMGHTIKQKEKTAN